MFAVINPRQASPDISWLSTLFDVSDDLSNLSDRDITSDCRRAGRWTAHRSPRSVKYVSTVTFVADAERAVPYRFEREQPPDAVATINGSTTEMFLK